MAKRGNATAIVVTIAALFFVLRDTAVVEARQNPPSLEHNCRWPIFPGQYYTFTDDHINHDACVRRDPNDAYHPHTPAPTATVTSTPNVTPTPTVTLTPTRTRRVSRPPLPRPTRTPTATSTPTTTPTATAVQTATPASAASHQGETQLAAPALTAEAVGNAVELRWEAVQNAVRYEILTWWDESIGWQPVGDNLTGTSHTHTNVMDGTTYYYSIRALNAAGEAGGWLLDYPVVTVSFPFESTQPVLAATVRGGANTIELRWDAVPGAVRYDLWAWTQTAGWQRLDAGSLTGASYTHTGLTTGTTYYYALRAVNAGGAASAWSEFVSAIAQ